MQDEGAIQGQGVRRGRRARTLGPCAAGDSRWAVSPSGHHGPLYQHLALQLGTCTCQVVSAIPAASRGDPRSSVPGHRRSPVVRPDLREDAFVPRCTGSHGNAGRHGCGERGVGRPRPPVGDATRRISGHTNCLTIRSPNRVLSIQKGAPPWIPPLPVRWAGRRYWANTPTANRPPSVWPV